MWADGLTLTGTLLIQCCDGAEPHLDHQILIPSYIVFEVVLLVLTGLLCLLSEETLLQCTDLASCVRLLKPEHLNTGLELIRRIQERLLAILQHSTQVSSPQREDMQILHGKAPAQLGSPMPTKRVCIQTVTDVKTVKPASSTSLVCNSKRYFNPLSKWSHS